MTELEAREAGGTLRSVLAAQSKAVLSAAVELQAACMAECRDNKPCLKCESIADLATQLDSAVAVAIGEHSRVTPTEWLDGVEGAIKDLVKK
jgi:hypothetical protein